MSSVRILPGGKARVYLPGLAADQYDGGSIGQATWHDEPGSNIHPDDHDDFWVWKRAESRPHGKGSVRIVTADVEGLDTLLIAMEALAIACEQGEETAAARACRTAAERLTSAITLLKKGATDAS